MTSQDNQQDINTSTKIMMLLDENKETMKEGLYLELSNLLMDKNKEEKNDKRHEEGFYEVKYFYTVSHATDAVGSYNSHIKSNTEIVRTSRCKATYFITEINKNGSVGDGKYSSLIKELNLTFQEYRHQSFIYHTQSDSDNDNEDNYDNESSKKNIVNFNIHGDIRIIKFTRLK